MPLALEPDWQVPAVSQYCGKAQVTVAKLSGDPPTRFTQVPTLPGTLHPCQVPRQALLQQTVSTQKPLPQSAPVEHPVAPIGFLFDMQIPLAQYWLTPSQGAVALWSGNPAGNAVQV